MENNGSAVTDDGWPKPGDHLTLHAEMDVFVVISNCPEALGTHAGPRDSIPVLTAGWDQRHRERRRNEVAWVLIYAQLSSPISRFLRRRRDACSPRYDDSNLTPFLLCALYGTGTDAVWQRNQGCFVIRVISEDDEDYSGAQRNAVAPALPCVVRTGFKRISGPPSANLVLDDDPIMEDEIGFSTAKLGALGNLRPTGVQALTQLRLQFGFGELLKGSPTPGFLNHIDEEGKVTNRGCDVTVKGSR